MTIGYTNLAMQRDAGWRCPAASLRFDGLLDGESQDEGEVSLVLHKLVKNAIVERVACDRVCSEANAVYGGHPALRDNCRGRLHTLVHETS